jgi:tyrosinase
VLRAYATAPDADTPGSSVEFYVGHHSVLSRRDIVRCANCLTHLGVQAFLSLDALSPGQILEASFRVEVQHRGHVLPDEFTYETAVHGLPENQ